MKFSELDEAGWPELQPYLDTCLLPVSGLEGDEAPWEMADRAGGAGAWLQPLEQAFRGRTVTLPAYHYYGGSPEDADKLRAVCGKCRIAGYKYVVLVSGRSGLLGAGLGADLIVQPRNGEDFPDPQMLRGLFSSLWGSSAAARGGLPGSEPER